MIAPCGVRPQSPLPYVVDTHIATAGRPCSRAYRSTSVLGLYPGADVRRQATIADDVVLGGAVAAPPTHRHIAAGEHEAAQARQSFDGDVEHVARALDVGVKQRRGVAQPAAGVDDAVVDDVAAGHRLAQHVVGVADVADEPRDLQVVDADGVGVVAHHDPYVVAVGDQLAGDVVTEKAVGADDQLGLFTCRRRTAASSSPPRRVACRAPGPCGTTSSSPTRSAAGCRCPPGGTTGRRRRR